MRKMEEEDSLEAVPFLRNSQLVFKFYERSDTASPPCCVAGDPASPASFDYSRRSYVYLSYHCYLCDIVFATVRNKKTVVYATGNRFSIFISTIPCECCIGGSLNFVSIKTR